MAWLELKIPPPVLGGLAFAVMPVAWYCRLWHLHLWPFPLAILSGVIGCVFLLPSWLQFFRAKTTISPTRPEKASRVVTTGVYGISRNPMYLGASFLLLAVALFFTDGVAVMMALLYPVYLNFFQIIPEERALEEKFGDEYREYKQRVRRWI